MRKALSLPVATLAAATLLSACGSSSKTTSTGSEPAAGGSTKTAGQETSGASTAAVVKTAANSTVGATVLVDAQGMTLYHLSGEGAGKFICTSAACEGVWHPLTVPAGSTPGGASSLGTVKRPDGTMQVTYNGEPLYTFAQDAQTGDAKGQGLKDVGTWSVVKTGGSSTTTTSESAGGGSGSGSGSGSESSSGGGGGGYAY